MTDEPEQVTPPSDQAQAAEAPQYREISKDELDKILGEHRKWLESNRQQGKQAQLGSANFENCNLSFANLQKPV